MYQVFPISIPSLDLTLLNKVIKECTGENATRESDKNNFPIGMKLVSALNRGNSRDAVRNESSILDHVNLSFLIVVDTEALLTLVSVGQVKLFIGETKRRGFHYVICTGSLLDWKQFTVTATHFDLIQSIGDELFKFLTSIGLSQLFSNCKQSEKEGLLYLTEN